MGIGFDAPDDSDSNDDSGTSSTESPSTSSSSGSSSDYPKERERVPYLAVYRDDHGDWQYRTNPQDLTIIKRKKHSSDSWSIWWVPDEVERFWMNKDNFRMHSSRVKNFCGRDLMSLLQLDPHKAIRTLKEAANRQTNSDTSSSHQTRDCQVCGEEHHHSLGDFRRVNNQVVCEKHSVEDLARNDML